MKKTIRFFSFIPLSLILFGFLFSGINCGRQIAPEELKASMELQDIDTRWEKKYYQPWPPKLILVPTISFKVKNTGEEPLSYVYFNAIFTQVGEKENLGDSFLAGIHGQPLLPGETSEEIILKSNFGVEGDNVDHFKNNPEWKTVEVEIFAKSKGSQYILIDEYTVSKKINFEEPEPVGMEEDEEKKKDDTKKKDREK
ncbi:MAG: hypothetical protein GF421_03870 [Candidatus Aminicenantes bacterium]|nr:hypothetical protein [Candidatus Aminicenantes bacterium]